MNYARNMPDTLTYWAMSGRNEFGEAQYSAPVRVWCRWQDKTVLFRDAQGQEVVSQAVIYTALPLTLKGYVFLGVSAETSPIGLSGAFEIRNVGASKNLSGTLTLNKVMI